MREPVADVSKLNGARLDLWVAKVRGIEAAIEHNCCYLAGSGDNVYRPSSDWSQAGPIIEKERIALFPEMTDDAVQWQAYIDAPQSSDEDDFWAAPATMTTGTTPLEAAMRCFVQSRLQFSGARAESAKASVRATIRAPARRRL